jgi:protein-tyrosine phosphatase
VTDSPGPFSVLVVCTANVCRSPAADALLRAALDAHEISASVASAGTRAVVGAPPCPVMTEAVVSFGVTPVETTAQRLTADLLLSADLVLVAERSHRVQAAQLAPATRSRTFTLVEARTLADALMAGRGSGDPVAGLRAAVELMHSSRGSVPVPGPTAAAGSSRTLSRSLRGRTALQVDVLDIADPHGLDRAAHQAAAVQLREAVGSVARLLAGERASGW